MKIWVTGAAGQVGHVLMELLKKRGIECVGTTHSQVDIGDESSVRSFAKGISHIINAAAFAQVDPAELNREVSYLANAIGPEVLAKVALELDARLIHISTDYVFDGKLRRPYREEDETNPLNWYGSTKREGEIRVLKTMPHACIVRASWIFGGAGTRHYVSQVLQLFRQKNELSFVDDQIGKPTYAPDFANALLELLDKSGVYHFSNSGQLSKYAFTRAIWEWAKQRNIPMVCEKIVPILSTEFVSRALRPLYTPLDTTKIESILPIRPWRDALAEYMCPVD